MGKKRKRADDVVQLGGPRVFCWCRDAFLRAAGHRRGQVVKAKLAELYTRGEISHPELPEPVRTTKKRW